MKKLIISFLMIITLTGCVKKNNTNQNNANQNEQSLPIEETEIIPQYSDANPLKIALYHKENGVYNRKDIFESREEAYKDIGLFSIILDSKEQVLGSSIKSLYQEYSQNYDNFSQYKIGYNISFTLENGTSFDEVILKPLDVFAYPFSDYLYIWLYDDINNSGSYSHLEEGDYNDNTVMSSIKLMATSLSEEIKGNIKVTVFTYDSEDDFLDGKYRGNSKFVMEIVKK